MYRFLLNKINNYGNEIRDLKLTIKRCEFELIYLEEARFEYRKRCLSLAELYYEMKTIQLVISRCKQKIGIIKAIMIA